MATLLSSHNDVQVRSTDLGHPEVSRLCSCAVDSFVPKTSIAQQTANFRLAMMLRPYLPVHGATTQIAPIRSDMNPSIRFSKL